MDLALPRFAGLGDGPRQVHLLWSVSSGCMSSGYKWTRGLTFSGGPGAGVIAASQGVGLSDLSITLLCDLDEVLTPVNSDQVLSDVDLPLESVAHDKRQVIRIRDVSPDVLLVDDYQVGRAWDSQDQLCV